MIEQPLPYGLPSGPECSLVELVAGFVAGWSAGSSPAAHIEYEALVAGPEPIAIRLDDAMLVRQEVIEEAADVLTALQRALSAAGMELAERDPPLAPIVETEVLGRRGDEWDLWAHDPKRGQQTLVARAAGDMPGLLEIHEEQQAEQARVAEVLRHIEDQL